MMDVSLPSLHGKHYINGEWHTGQGMPFYSVNPVDNTLLWQGHAATKEEVARAVFHAQWALNDWALLPLAKRINYLEHFVKQLEKHRQVLITMISLETGKPLWESATEVNAVIGKIALSIQAIKERQAEQKTTTPDALACLRYKPHGLAVVLGAFNFPAHLSNGHIVPALLAGNTVIYKPSELTPGVADIMMHCWHEANLPRGVISCCQGDVETSKTLLAEDIQAVYFTGSYKAGQAIHQFFQNKPEMMLALEMGGNNPLVIDEPQNIKAAVYQTLLSSYISAGQRCTCARRLFVKNTAKGDEFLHKLLQAMNRIKVGAFTDKPEPFMGPVIRHGHAMKHLDAQQQLINTGGIALAPMQLLKPESGFLSPGLIDMTGVQGIKDEEIFAPLLQVFRYEDFEDALSLANQTRYGLVAGLIGDNAKHYQQFYQTIRAGLINWNRPTTGALSSLPFGGIGRSGNHRPSAYFAADYCAYPVASLEEAHLIMPEHLLPGLIF